MFGKRALKLSVTLTIIFATLIVVGSALAGGVTPNLTTVHWFADGSEVQGARSQLLRMDGGFNYHINTKSLNPGHLFTVWGVVFNMPGNCSGGVCDENDVFNPDMTLNVGQITAVDISVIYVGGFEVNNNAGVGNVNGTVYEGLPMNPGQAFGAPFSQTGLGDAIGAEIHFIVRDHGPPQDGLAYEQMSTFGGGCNNVPAFHPGYVPGIEGNYTCEDPQFAVHLP